MLSYGHMTGMEGQGDGGGDARHVEAGYQIRGFDVRQQVMKASSMAVQRQAQLASASERCRDLAMRQEKRGHG